MSAISSYMINTPLQDDGYDFWDYGDKIAKEYVFYVYALRFLCSFNMLATHFVIDP